MLKNKVFLFLCLVFISLRAFAFELPWQIKDYKNFNECLDATPKFDAQLRFLHLVCGRVYTSEKKLSSETRKFLLCTRQKVLKEKSRKDSRAAIFKCADDYPPKSNKWPLALAQDFFPTNDELAETRASERAGQRMHEMMMRDLMRPTDCIVTSMMVSCY